MAVDFEDVARAVTLSLEEATSNAVAALKESLYEATESVLADLEGDDADECADAAGYPVGEVGADDESELDALHTAYAEGYAAAVKRARELFEAAKNI